MSTEKRMVASVRFPGSDREYDYAVPRWVRDIEAGDHAIVEGRAASYVIVEVTAVRDRLESEWEGEFKPIVQVVDDGPFRDCQRRITRMEQIRRELRRRSRERVEVTEGRQLAGTDKELNLLVDELEQIRREV